MTDSTPHDDLDDEFELEPVDPEILEHERKRAIRKTRKAEDAIDINEAYQEAQAGDLVDFGELKKIRFSIKHLLILTAMLSVVMATYEILDGCNTIFILLIVTVAAGWWFVNRRERQQTAEAERRRQEVKSQIAARRAAEDGKPIETVPRPEPEEIPVETPAQAPLIDFSFSMKEMFGALTAAAVLLGLTRWMGGPENAALLLGAIALLGLVVHVAGYDPPHILVLGWWLLLVLYLVISIWAAFSAEEVALSMPPPDLFRTAWRAV